MAQEDDEKGDQDDDDRQSSGNGGVEQDDQVEEEDDNGDKEEEDDEEDEPRLNYTSLTKYLRPLYRNGDATSAFVVAGNKMVGQAFFPPQHQ